MPQPNTQSVTPPTSSAAVWLRLSMPTAPPLMMITPTFASEPAST